MTIVEAIRRALTRYGEISITYEEDGRPYIIGISKQGYRYIAHRGFADEDPTEMRNLTREDAVSTMESFVPKYVAENEELIAPVLLAESYWTYETLTKP